MNTRAPHKHAEFIKAWADGAEIEFCNGIVTDWETVETPSWSLSNSYRVKLERKPNKVKRYLFDFTPYVLRAEFDIKDPANPVLVSTTWEKS